jgi:colanic acid/amylovoran biosynthesis glycosyltransferase
MENLDQFPFEPIVSPDNMSYFKRTILKNIGTYTWRHYYWFYDEFVKKYNINIFHAQFGYEAVFARPILRSFSNIPLIISFYGADISVLPKKHFWKVAYKNAFKRAAVVLAEGEHMKTSLINMGCPSDKVIVQHLGIELDKYPYNPRIRVKGDNREIQIIHCASFREKKGHKYAIQAFAVIQQQFPNTSLRLIGDGPLLNEIKTLVQSLGIQNKVHFLGKMNHLQTINELVHADILLYPSVTASDGDSEGGAPVAIIEALATGMPVVSSRHADIPDVIIHGRNGFLAQERNVEELVSYLKFLLIHTDQWESIGKAGRVHIEREYNLLRQISSLENIYTKVI